MGRDAVDYLLLPWRVILEGGRGYDHFDGELGAFWIVVLPVRRRGGFWYCGCAETARHSSRGKSSSRALSVAVHRRSHASPWRLEAMSFAPVG